MQNTLTHRRWSSSCACRTCAQTPSHGADNHRNHTPERVREVERKRALRARLRATTSGGAHFARIAAMVAETESALRSASTGEYRPCFA